MEFSVLNVIGQICHVMVSHVTTRVNARVAPDARREHASFFKMQFRTKLAFEKLKYDAFYVLGFILNTHSLVL